MSAVENCGGSCLLGIQPGITHTGAALRQLQSHPWVGAVQQNAPGNGYAQISWEWSGQQPAVVDDTQQGKITFYWDDDNVIPLNDTVVETVTVYTTMRHYSLQKLLGESDGSSATLRPDGKLGYSVLYDIPRGILNLYVETDCPFNLMRYWNARARMTLSIGRNHTGSVDPTRLASACNPPHD